MGGWVAGLFLKSSAREVKIFQNLQLLSRSFFEMHSSVIDHFSKSSAAGLLFFFESSARDAFFSGNPQLPYRTFL